MEETYEWDKNVDGVAFKEKEDSGERRRVSELGNSKSITEHINDPPEVGGHDSKGDQSTRLHIFLQAQS